MHGKLLIIEGLDGSGKATQAERLTQTLKAQGRRVRKVSFPNFESDSSALVKLYLSGAFGSDPGDVNAYAASVFFAVDRYAGFKSDWGAFYREGGIVVADRYTTSNAVHQCSKLPWEEWDGYLNWLFELEYRLMGIPAPDGVVYLKLDPDVSQALMTKRYHGHEEMKDIHERNVDYLKHSARAAEYCAKKYDWLTVECCADGAMRSIEDIQAEVFSRLTERALL